MITGVFLVTAVLVLAVMFVLDRRSDEPTTGATGLVAAGTGASAGGEGALAAPDGAATDGVDDAAAPSADPQAEPELDDTADDDAPCLISQSGLRPGASGDEVVFLQEALQAHGELAGNPTGSYDGATEAAVRKLQEERHLYVDGIAGRETGIALGIWPDETSTVVHTPAPAAGAVDAMGFRLSSVASTGAGAPSLPGNSGSGRRLVYERAGQRVWAVAADGSIIRSWLVSGSMYHNEQPGTHKVYSRSEVTTAWNGRAFLPKMVRWLKTQRGAIGFHAIPIKVADRSVYQTEDQLGTRLSGGCQRQANLDAAFTWAFAQIGTPVVVL